MAEPFAQDVGQFQGIADKVFHAHILWGEILRVGFAGPTLVPMHHHEVFFQFRRLKQANKGRVRQAGSTVQPK